MDDAILNWNLTLFPTLQYILWVIWMQRRTSGFVADFYSTAKANQHIDNISSNQ